MKGLSLHPSLDLGFSNNDGNANFSSMPKHNYVSRPVIFNMSSNLCHNKTGYISSHSGNGIIFCLKIARNSVNSSGTPHRPSCLTGFLYPQLRTGYHSLFAILKIAIVGISVASSLITSGNFFISRQNSCTLS